MITNTVNGRTYVGVHQTTNINDGYMGSGKVLKRAIQKYGIENFSKTILATYDNPTDMFAHEVMVVNEAFIEDKSTYNIRLGGDGTHGLNNNPDIIFRRTRAWSRYGTAKVKELMATDLKFKEKMLVIFRRNAALANAASAGKWKTMSANEKLERSQKIKDGLTPRARQRQKDSLRNIKHQQGERNSQYGTCWMYSDVERRSIKVKKDSLDEWIVKGWSIGRKIKF